MLLKPEERNAKITLMGNHYTGKSSLFHSFFNYCMENNTCFFGPKNGFVQDSRYLNGQKHPKYYDFSKLKISILGVVSDIVDIIDLNGFSTMDFGLEDWDEKVMSKTDKPIFTQASTIMMSFALNNYCDLNALSKQTDYRKTPWLELAREYGIKNYQILLVGTKSDQTRAIDPDRVIKSSKKNNFLGYIETSVTKNENVNEVFELSIGASLVFGNYITCKTYERFARRLNKEINNCYVVEDLSTIGF